MIKIFVVLICITSCDCYAKVWNHASEVGVLLVSGNTVSKTENLKHQSKINWQQNEIKLNGKYFHFLTEKDSNENWSLGVRFERVYSEKLNWYLGNSVESNRPSGFEHRLNSDIGLKKINYKNKLSYLFSEIGYRFAYEKKIKGAQPSIDRTHFLRLFVEKGVNLYGVAGFKAWIELLPDILRLKNYQVNSEISASIILTKVLSFKISYLYKFDNIPSTKTSKKVDRIFTTNLIAKY